MSSKPAMTPEFAKFKARQQFFQVISSQFDAYKLLY